MRFQAFLREARDTVVREAKFATIVYPIIFMVAAVVTFAIGVWFPHLQARQ
jgi:hypothetical protein